MLYKFVIQLLSVSFAVFPEFLCHALHLTQLYDGQFRGPAGIMISTYTMMAYTGQRSAQSEELLKKLRVC